MTTEAGENTSFEKHITPLAILAAGMFIGGGLYFGLAANGMNDQTVSQAGAPTGENDSPIAQNVSLASVSAEDHIRGNADAPVKLIEFSDFECPFCQRFHTTMQQIVEEYDGKVAWVYRHYPLVQLHQKAYREAVASECAAELGGNGAFWKFTDRIFEITPANDGLDHTQLPEIAAYVGVDRAAFSACLEGDAHNARIDRDIADAQNARAQGTPYSVVVAPNGKTFVINGAQPYEAVKRIVDLALEES
ncbi:MAG: thioredoxin domain-containing protein [Candidatus Spechtbacterales bacterium]